MYLNVYYYVILILLIIIIIYLLLFILDIKYNKQINYKLIKDKNEVSEKSISEMKYYENIICKIDVLFNKFNWKTPFIHNDIIRSSGSGFFISDKYILTASHVVQDSEDHQIQISIPNNGKKKYNIKVISIYPSLDFALLEIINFRNKFWFNIFKNTKNIIKKGYMIKTLGYPLGQEKLKITKGIISGIDNGLLQIDAPINPGNSGGPLIDNNNNVIGINVSGIIESNNIGYSVPIQRIIENYNLFFKHKILYLPVLGSQLSKINDYFFIKKNQKNVQGLMIYNILNKSNFSKNLILINILYSLNLINMI